MPDMGKIIGLLQETEEYFRECRNNASFASKAENHFWELQNAANEAIELLKAQGSIEPVLDETTKRFYRCGACGEYVGFIDSDPGDPNEQDNYCRNCGREVKWK